MTTNREGAIPLRERLSLAERWEAFEKKIIPADAGQTQRVEMRRAWYAGASAMFVLMTGELDADHEPTDLDVAYVESLHQELMAFAGDLRAGRA